MEFGRANNNNERKKKKKKKLENKVGELKKKGWGLTFLDGKREGGNLPSFQGGGKKNKRKYFIQGKLIKL